MCSIGGFISSQPLDSAMAKRLCGALIFYGSARGQQSAGIYVNSRLYKRAVHPADFIYDDGFDELFDIDPSCALVHTRQPTSGGTGDEQAHPFWIGNTITVHNGGIMNCAELKKKWSLTKPSGVDSELMTSALDNYGIARLPEIVKDLSGSAAVAALHHGELYLMRDGNPLEYYELKLTINTEGDTNLLVFGSTMSQVKDAIAHCWLIKSFGITTTLPTGKIFKCSAASVLTEVGAFDTAGHTYSNMYRGMGGAPTNPTRRSTAIQMDGQTGTSRINLYQDGAAINIYGEEFSLQAAAIIIESSEEELPPPSRAGGWGLKSLPNDCGVMYSHKLAAAQHLKYDTVFSWARRLIQEPPLSRKERKKLLRDRNKTAATT